MALNEPQDMGCHHRDLSEKPETRKNSKFMNSKPSISEVRSLTRPIIFLLKEGPFFQYCTYLKEIGITKGCGQAENEVPLRMLWNSLHNRPIDDDEMSRGRFHALTFF